MSAILNFEDFVAIESAVKASTAPVEIAAAFAELAALSEQLKKLASRRVVTSKP
jgi:hypothetical protein